MKAAQDRVVPGEADPGKVVKTGGSRSGFVVPAPYMNMHILDESDVNSTR